MRLTPLLVVIIVGIIMWALIFLGAKKAFADEDPYSQGRVKTFQCPPNHIAVDSDDDGHPDICQRKVDNRGTCREAAREYCGDFRMSPKIACLNAEYAKCK